MKAFLTIFWRVPKISKIVPKTRRTFPNIFQKFSKISEDFHFEEDPKVFRSYTTEFKYNLRDELEISEIIDIFTPEDMEIRYSSPGCSFVWILRVVYFPVKHSCL